ncbi:hypothetical protein ACM66B_000444 [Microbotryomycetes sp. NB124-2]
MSSDKPSPLRHGASAAERQAHAVQRLLSNPDRPVHIPQGPKLTQDGVVLSKQLRAPREMMRNVQGSSAGAGSGEFHVYKQSRRREYERLKLMDEEESQKKEREEALERQRQSEQAAEAKTAKNRLKRQRKKQHRKGAGGHSNDNKDGTAGVDSDDEKEGAGASGSDKKRKLAGGGTFKFKTAEERDAADGDDDNVAGGSHDRSTVAINGQDGGALDQEDVAPAKEAGIFIQDDD